MEEYIAKHGKVCDQDPGWPGMESCEWRSPAVPMDVKKRLLKEKRDRIAAAKPAPKAPSKHTPKAKVTQVKKPSKAASSRIDSGEGLHL